jgi:dTDP-4-dehydrorhamnose reductase
VNAGGWKRPLIIGASGQVGTELARALGEEGAATTLLSSRAPQDGWLQLDLSALKRAEDAARVLDEAAPDLIVCSGAMTFVDGCEESSEAAFLANAHGPSALASYARLRGVPFVYLSSDYVFDGTEAHRGPYSELATPKPLSVYGESKLQGERAVLRVHPGALILRTSWVYGADGAGKNFLSSLLRQLGSGQRMRVPADQVSTPTYNRDLAAATVALAGNGATGIVHVTGPEVYSRYRLAQEMAQFFGLDATLIDGVSTAALGQRAIRPLHSGLVSYRLPELLPKFRMRTLSEGLSDARHALVDLSAALTPMP